ncbi:Uncharacterised protein [Bordetella pertussis]|nr:Uncharacterised protein [Bordetella pertussis]
MRRPLAQRRRRLPGDGPAQLVVLAVARLRAQQPGQSARQQREDEHQDQAVDDVLVIVEGLQLLRQVGEQHGAVHLPGQRTQATDDGHHQDLDRTHQAEALGREIADHVRIEAAGQSRQAAADGVGGALDRRLRNAQRAGGDFADVHGVERPAVMAFDEVAQHQHDHQQHRQQDAEVRHRIDAPAEDLQRADLRGRDAAHAHPPAGHAAQLARQFVDDQAEAQRHHRQVELAHPARRPGQQEAHARGHDGGHGQRHGKRHAPGFQRNGADVGADGEKARMPQGDLAVDAGQQVDALGQQDIDDDEAPHLHRAGVGMAGAHGQRNGQHAQRPGVRQELS